MTNSPDPTSDPTNKGVPPETPDASKQAAIDQTLEDAEGGIEASTLDAPNT